MSSEANKQRGIRFPSQTAKVKILLVDEDAGELKMYRLTLEGQGFEVVTCTSFEAGARCLEKDEFDFVLVGQGSVAFEGRTVVDRAMQANRYRPVLVVTRCTDMHCYLEAMQMGAVDYLEKPLPPTDLVRFVKSHVHHQAQLQGSYAS